MNTNKSNLSNLSRDIRNAVSLFAEFGSRGEYIRKGRVVIVNDVNDPKQEGIFLARCARQIAKREGVEFAHEWAMKAFSDNVYNRLQTRNKVHESEISAKLKDYNLKRFLHDISYQF